MIVDLGTGDGRAVLASAAAEPRSLVIGMDANAASMADSSRRAAGPARKGGLPNALFVVAAAESPPPELFGRADLVMVLFPWGSLLRGFLGLEASVARGIAGLVRPGGEVVALVSVTPRDGVEGVVALDAATIARARDAFEQVGLDLCEARPATPAEVHASGSSWGRRLSGSRYGSGPRGEARPVWRLRFRRRPADYR